MDVSTVPQLEVKHLRLIRTIAETQNLTRAAEQLTISQPALSRQLLDIEDRLGAPFFYRSKKRMLLTPEGTRILKSARLVLDELEMAELDISKMVNGESGRLRIGVSCMYCFKWLPGVMAEFQAYYPKVELTISSCADAADALNRKAYDMVVTATPVTDGGLGRIDLFSDELVMIVSPESPISTRRWFLPADLAHTKLILSSQMHIVQFSSMLWPGVDVSPAAVMQVDQPGAVIELVKAGLGISVAPRWAVRSFLSSGTLSAVPISAKGVFPVWRAVYLENGPLPVYRQKFVDLMKKQKLP